MVAYLRAWFRGPVYSGQPGRYFFMNFQDVMTCGPVRLASAFAITAFGVMVGDWLGSPRLAAALALFLAIGWLLWFSGGLSALAYLSGASPRATLVVTLAGFAAAVAGVYWTVAQIGPGSPSLPFPAAYLKTAAVLTVVDVAGIYGDVRMMRSI